MRERGSFIIDGIDFEVARFVGRSDSKTRAGGREVVERVHQIFPFSYP